LEHTGIAQITGAAGVGKTVVAAQLAQQSGTEDQIFWHSCYHAEDLLHQSLSLAEKINQTEIVASTLTYSWQTVFKPEYSRTGYFLPKRSERTCHEPQVNLPAICYQSFDCALSFAAAQL